MALVVMVAACGARRERVFVSDEDGGVVVVLDAASEEVIARVPVGKRPRGLRVSPDGRKLFVALSGSPKVPPGADPASAPPADRDADGIGVIDLDSLQLVRTIHAGQDPELFDVTRDGKRLWVSNEETAEASLVDVESGVVVRRVPVGAEPEGVGIHPSGKEVYVTSEEDAAVAVLDAASGDRVARVPVCGRPRAVVFSLDGARAFVSCENGAALAVIDARSHTLVGQVPLAGARPMGLAVSPDGKRLFASGGRGKAVYELVLEGEPRVARMIADAGARPWGVGLARGGQRLFTANGPSGDVSVIDTASGKVAQRIAVGGSPWGIAVR